MYNNQTFVPSQARHFQQDLPDMREIPSDGKYKLYLAGGIICSIVLVIFALTIATSRTSWRGSAATPISSTVISLANSYVFASPLSANADGVSPIRITVFILNNQGLGVSQQEVSLKTTGNLKQEKIQSLTDTFGRAIYEVTSTTAGSYTINAEVSNNVLPQAVSISFQ